MNEAAVGPPGVIPIQQPMRRCAGAPTNGVEADDGVTTFGAPPNLRGDGSCMPLLYRDEQFADAEETHHRHHEAYSFHHSLIPMVKRTLPETVSMPTAARAKPRPRKRGLEAATAPPSPTKLAKARK